MQPGNGMDRGFALGAQAGAPQLMVAVMARSWAPRLLWKPRDQRLPGLLVAWRPHSRNGDEVGLGKWRWAVLQQSGSAPGTHCPPGSQLLWAGPATTQGPPWRPGCRREKLPLPYPLLHADGNRSTEFLSGLRTPEPPAPLSALHNLL